MMSDTQKRPGLPPLSLNPRENVTPQEVQKEMEALRKHRRVSMQRTFIDPDLPDLAGTDPVNSYAGPYIPPAEPNTPNTPRAPLTPSDEGGDPPADFSLDEKSLTARSPVFGSTQRERYLARRAARANASTDSSRTSEDSAASDDAKLATPPADSANHFWVPASAHPEISPEQFRAFIKEQAERNMQHHALNPGLAQEGENIAGEALLSRGMIQDQLAAKPSLRRNASITRRASSLRRQVRPEKEGDATPVRAARRGSVLAPPAQAAAGAQPPAPSERQPAGAAEQGKPPAAQERAPSESSTVADGSSGDAASADGASAEDTSFSSSHHSEPLDIDALNSFLMRPKVQGPAAPASAQAPREPVISDESSSQSSHVPDSDSPRASSEVARAEAAQSIDAELSAKTPVPRRPNAPSHPPPPVPSTAAPAAPAQPPATQEPETPVRQPIAAPSPRTPVRATTLPVPPSAAPQAAGALAPVPLFTSEPDAMPSQPEPSPTPVPPPKDDVLREKAPLAHRRQGSADQVSQRMPPREPIHRIPPPRHPAAQPQGAPAPQPEAAAPQRSMQPAPVASRRDKKRSGFSLSWFGLSKDEEELTDRKAEKEGGRRRDKDTRRKNEPDEGLAGAPTSVSSAPPRRRERDLLSSLFGKRRADSQDSLKQRGWNLFSAISGSNVGPPATDFNYTRFPLHIERAIYRLSHFKLANPRRPLAEQVMISNLMFWYLSVINMSQVRPTCASSENGGASRISEYDDIMRRFAAGTPPVSANTGSLGFPRRRPLPRPGSFPPSVMVAPLGGAGAAATGMPTAGHDYNGMHVEPEKTARPLPTPGAWQQKGPETYDPDPAYDDTSSQDDYGSTGYVLDGYYTSTPSSLSADTGVTVPPSEHDSSYLSSEKDTMSSQHSDGMPATSVQDAYYPLYAQHPLDSARYAAGAYYTTTGAYGAPDAAWDAKHAPVPPVTTAPTAPTAAAAAPGAPNAPAAPSIPDTPPQPPAKPQRSPRKHVPPLPDRQQSQAVLSEARMSPSRVPAQHRRVPGSPTRPLKSAASAPNLRKGPRPAPPPVPPPGYGPLELTTATPRR